MTRRAMPAKAAVLCLMATAIMAPLHSAGAAVLKADYEFAGTFASSVAGAPDLIATDPLGTSSFGNDQVLGVSRSVYNFNGSNTPSDQGGLTFNNGAGLIGSNSYSFDVLFKLNERDGAWRIIANANNRQSDNGFYVDPSNNLDIYPNSSSTITFRPGTYYDVVLTNDNGLVTVYGDGGAVFSAQSGSMTLGSDNLLDFFLDNVVGGGQGEWSSGSVAKIALYDGALSADDVASLYGENTTPPAMPVPEPASAALLVAAFCVAGILRRYGANFGIPGPHRVSIKAEKSMAR